jgi:precorrin-3B C17-methyltransferase
MAQPDPGRGQGLPLNGRLAVVSLGPGDETLLTPQAGQVLAEAEVIAGYQTYLRLLPDKYLEGKEILSTGMRHEVERVQRSIDLALAGRRVALVCSGDAGIYSLAGLRIGRAHV